MQKNPNWGGRRSGSGRPKEHEIVKVPVVRAKTSDALETEKWLFMCRLSDKEPSVIPTFSIEMPCQTVGCSSVTNHGIIQMVNHVWSIRPICGECLIKSQDITVVDEKEKKNAK